MTLKNIEHIVVLMLENRSFDSMLGWLYQQDRPEAFVPPNAQPVYRGLQAVNPDAFVNTALGGTLSAKPMRGAKGFTVPDIAPGEEFEQVVTQFYGSAKPPPNAQITMKGFLQDYVEVLQKRGLKDPDVRRQAPMVMQSFTPGQAPVLNQLARHYAVCDGWYASVPSQTNPNRSFLMCGTSAGMINNGDLETNPQAKALEKILGMAIGDDRVDATTIFNALHEANVDWDVYYQTSYLPQKISVLLEQRKALLALLAVVSPAIGAAVAALLVLLNPYVQYLTDLTSGQLGSCYTWRLFPHIKDKIPHADKHFHKLDEFHRKARAGKLPKFSYIEPFWTISHTTVSNPVHENLFTALGNDYHPPGSVLAGEQFVKEVYTSLIANKAAWEKTLLLITFDEFVGSFDHQTADLQPGKVQPPWAPNGAPIYKNRAGFKFDRLGARVPTIVVSPYVRKGTVFRSPTATPFDHTSVIATTLEAINRKDLLPRFGARAGNAPSFAEVVTLDRPRTDPILPFVDVARKNGEPVRYGETFVLKNQHGKYLSPAYCTMKVAGGGSVIPTALMGICVDLGVAAYFPTLGHDGKAPLSFVTQSPDPAGQINNNAQVLLISRESGPGARNVLGAWADSHDCYYYDEYLDGDNLRKQTWVIQKVDNPNQPLRYGEKVKLANVFYKGQHLSRDNRPFQSEWLTTSTNGDYWTVEPGPARV
ncbi:MAG: hypothetical protein J7521_20520 [Caulobacter sp.]|nr:hypothetical protein [Caulobacter sp.]